MGLVRHTNHLEACYNVGPHTISFPRIKDASTLNLGTKYFVNDEDFAKLIAILRLAVPYTGMILTAREPAFLRNEIIQFGVSQIDGGTKIELGSYTNTLNHEQNLNKGQFRINDERSLNEIIDELLENRHAAFFLYFMLQNGQDRRTLHGVFSSGFYQEILYTQCNPDPG